MTNPPQSPQPLGIIGMSTPPTLADAIVSRKARTLSRWASAGMAAAGFYSWSVWLSVQTPGRELTAIIFGELMSLLGAFLGLIFALITVLSLRQVLQALRDRATYITPPLARSAADIHTMHMWIGPNIVGPVRALAESGSTAVLGLGRYVWYSTWLLWPIAIAWFFFAETRREYFQAGIITVVAFAATAGAANLLQLILSPAQTQRLVQPARATPLEPGFWARGLRPGAAEKTAAEKTAAEKITGDLSDFVDDYYR